MEKGIIEKLQECGNASDLNYIFKNGGVFNDKLAAKEKQVEIVSLEDNYPERFRFRGNFATQSFKSFVDLVNERKDGETFIDADSMTAKTIFNIGTIEKPGHCDDTALLTLKKTAAYIAMLDSNEIKKPQLNFSDWAQEFADFITFKDGDGAVLDFAKSVAAIKSLDIKQQKNINSTVSSLGYEKSGFEKIQAESANIIPEGFIFDCVPFAGLMARKFYCVLRIVTGEKPLLFFRVQQFEIIAEDMTIEFLEKIQKAIEGKARIGSFKKV